MPEARSVARRVQNAVLVENPVQGGPGVLLPRQALLLAEVNYQDGNYQCDHDRDNFFARLEHGDLC